MASLIIPSRDFQMDDPYTSGGDESAYSEAAAAKEIELRVANATPGAGTLIIRRTNVSQISRYERIGRLLDLLQTTTSTTPDTNVTAATYSTTNPTGYSGNSLEIQATGASSTDRGCRKVLSTGAADLSVYGGGTMLRFQRRCTSVTNLVRWVVRFEFATANDYAEFSVFEAADTINTWAEVTVAKGNPRATAGTVDWALFSGTVRWFAGVSGAYTGNLEARDFRLGTTQTAKTTPDGYIAWESSVDVRRRYRDNATAKATTTLAAASAAAATNIKVTSVSNLAAGDEITLETAGFVETRSIQTVGTAGSGGSGVTVYGGFTYAHNSADPAVVYYWGTWGGWDTVKASEPPAVSPVSPLQRALVTDPTTLLDWTTTSPGGKSPAQRAMVVKAFQRLGFANRVLAMNGLLSYVRLGEPSGSFVDSGPSGITGTASGSMTRSAAGALSPSDADAAVDFTGGYVTFGDVHDFPGAAPFSAAAWVNPDTIDATYRGIISKSAASPREGWWVSLHSSSGITLERANNGTQYGVSAPAASITTGAWYRVLATFDGTSGRVYVNGVLKGGPTAMPVSLAGNASPLLVGAAFTGLASFLDGRTDEFSIWDRALSDAEALADFAARLELPGDQEIYNPGRTVDSTTDRTLPAFLLTETAQVIAWDIEAEDPDGLKTLSARKAFTTSFSAPAAPTGLTATPDPDTSSVALAWTASAGPNVYEHRVYWRNGVGTFVQVATVGAAATTYTDAGARPGDNEYQVTAHTGAMESAAATAEATLTALAGGSGAFVREDDERHTIGFIVYGAPRTREPGVESFRPPGRGVPVHLKWGISGRHVSVTIKFRPVADGDMPTLFDELLDGDLPGWLKFGAGWLRDPLWCQVVGVSDQIEVGGWAQMTVEFEETS